MEDSTLVNIAIDSERKSVKKGAVHIVENLFPFGCTATLKGQFYFFVGAGEKGADVCAALEQGLRWTATYGSLRTVGFGRVVSIRTEALETAISEPVPSDCAEFHDLSLRFRDPFCIVKRRISDNTFESSDTVPGGALKGAIASMLNAMFGRKLSAGIDDSLPGTWAALGKNFGNIRFLHAVPSSLARRPYAMPHSLVRIDAEQMFDAAAIAGSFLLQQKSPRFLVDWKAHEWVSAKKAMNIETPKSELRVRTAIDVDLWRAAEHQLFAYYLIIPGDLEWRSVLDLSRVNESDRPAVMGCLKSLFGIGLYGIGKTKARAAVTCSKHTAAEILTNTGDSRTWVVTFQTPVLLASFHDRAIGMDTDAMAKTYADAWSKLSNKALQLKRYYSHESLAGGGYIKNRFRSNVPYNPFLLTEAGSVFVLEAQAGKEKVASDLLTDWMRHGLPLPEKVKQSYGEEWARNPYLCENGYGEIAVNLFYDVAPRPPDNDLTLIESPPWWSAMETRNDNIVSGGIA